MIKVRRKMALRASSDRHEVRWKQTVYNPYYIDVILAKIYSDVMSRLRQRRTILKRKMNVLMSTKILLQDDASCNNTKTTQKWCRKNCSNFWEVGMFQGNSPDLNPIKDLSSILQTEFDLVPESTSVPMLTRNLETAWEEIKPFVRHNLVTSMPKRIKLCIQVVVGVIDY